jgi:hypothetical protein
LIWSTVNTAAPGVQRTSIALVRHAITITKNRVLASSSPDDAFCLVLSVVEIYVRYVGASLKCIPLKCGRPSRIDYIN